MPEPLGSASPGDDFDALLAPPAPASGRAAAPPVPASVGASERHSHSSEDATLGPRLAEFAQNWDLYRDPVLAAVLAGAALAALGVFVLLRRAVFVTAALSQAAGLGVALAFYAQIHLNVPVSPVLGAITMAALVTMAVGVRRTIRISREAVVGFLFVAASALAVLVGDCISQEAHDIAAILFGTAVLVRPLDLALLAVSTVVSLGGISLLSRALTFTGLDPDGARVQGLPVRAIELGFWALFALQVSLATRALGSLPVFAFAVLPAATGLMLANRVTSALVVAVAAGVLSGGLGYLVAFLGELPVGAAQATTAAALSLCAFALSKLRRA